MPRRLAIVAGAGALAPQVAEAALSTGDVVCVFCLSPLDLSQAIERQAASIEHPGALFEAIRRFRASHVVLAGAVTLTDGDRRRLLSALGSVGQSMGDAALSHLAVRLQDLTGAELIGPHEVAPDLLAGSGHLAGPVASDVQLAAGRLALLAARQTGAMDMGQAAVVSGSRIVAAEDVAGTDELLARIGRYSTAGLIGDSAESPLVLGKACKPQQPLFVDLPAIGPRTIAGAAGAGIGLIAVEAGKTLLLEREKLFVEADSHAVTIVGLPLDE